MKKLFVFCFLLTSCFGFANKKIVLLEPRVGDGSSEVSSMEKAMIRGELRKAIVNHTGYEAFTRTDIDQLMQEQDFQRTGNVSANDVHKLGEMTGADYLCISTINKSNTEFYIEAYLIHVESAGISNPASQYGELISGKLANMLPVCQALAQELLGTSAPIISTSYASAKEETPKKASTQKVPAEKKQEEPMPANDIPSQNAIGTLKTFSDGTRGLIFYLDENGRGLCISLVANKSPWDTSRGSKMQDVINVPNQEEEQSFMISGQGQKYTQAILHQLGATGIAAYWCTTLGNGWYLPSAEELRYFMRTANGGMGPKGAMSQRLVANGGVPIANGWYWSSSETDRDEALNVSITGSVSTEDKDEVNWVRAMRAF